MSTVYDNPFTRLSTSPSDFDRYSSDVLNRPIQPYQPSSPSTVKTPEDEQKYTNEARRREAVQKAMTRLSSTNTGGDQSGSKDGSGASVVGGSSTPVSSDGSAFRSYPMIIQQPQQQKSGLGAAIGTLAGIGASFIPGLGPGIAAAMPAIGGNIGSLFG